MWMRFLGQQRKHSPFVQQNAEGCDAELHKDRNEIVSVTCPLSPCLKFFLKQAEILQQVLAHSLLKPL